MNWPNRPIVQAVSPVKPIVNVGHEEKRDLSGSSALVPG